MKKLIWMLLPALLLFALLTLGAHGEEAVFQGKFTASLDAEYLDFGDLKADSLEDLISYLQKFPNLKKVDMFSTPVEKKAIDQLAKAFPQVEFGWTMRLRCNNPRHPERTYHEIRTDALVFSTLHNNECTLHTSEELSIVKYCKNLLALDIGHNNLTDISFLYELPKLRVLIIAINDITDAAPVASLKDLEYLEIFHNRLKSVAGFENLTRLMDLNIGFNYIQDYTPLESCKSLQRLWLYNSNNYVTNGKVPPEAVSALRKALPDAKVDPYSYGTLGEWRWKNDVEGGDKVPHYAVISEMFNTGVYIPFAESAPLED